MSRPLRQAERIGRAIDDTWSQARLVLLAAYRMRSKLGAITGQLSESSSNPVEVALLSELQAIDSKLKSAASLVASVGMHFSNVTSWLPKREDRRG